MNVPIFTIDEIRDRLSPVFKKYSVGRAVLFGSYAKGCATADSDVDIVVDTDLRGLRFMNLYCDVKIALNNVDLDLFARYELVSGGRAELEIENYGRKIYEA